MADQQIRFSLRRLFLLVALISAIFAGVRFVYTTYASVIQGMEELSAIWLTHDMLSQYMSQNEGAWPNEWEDMRSEFDYFSGHYGAPDIGWVKARVHVDFDFDPAMFREGASVAITPLMLPDGRSNGELQAANDSLFEYIQRHPLHARTDPASTPDTPSDSLPAAGALQ